MPEEFLHYLWKYQAFNKASLTAVNGQSVEILNPGILNHDAGPDFLCAKVRIGKLVWSGHVEIHVWSSDWDKHSHQFDAAYDNVILHVVYSDDRIIFKSNGQQIPTLELMERIDSAKLKTYTAMKGSLEAAPCSPHLGELNQLSVSSWLDRMAVERLEQKSKLLKSRLHELNNDWDALWYEQLMKAMGLKVNQQPFEELARSLPWKALSREHQLVQKEALLLGQAGFLKGKPKDAYTRDLAQRYSHLKQKYQLQVLPNYTWRFMRMYPTNFPTIRLAQVASLFVRFPRMFSLLLESANEELTTYFECIPSSYWEDHYLLGKEASRKVKTIGRDRINLILINAWIPMLYLYGKHKGEHYQEKALDLLHSLPSEQNKVIRYWSRVGLEASSALDSQGLLNLKHEYCHHKRCLSCTIGNMVLQGETKSIKKGL